MTKFNFFSLLILALFYNTTNIFSQNEVISIDIKKYDYLKSESYKIKTIEINGNKRTKKDIILRELSIKEDEIIDKNIIISKVEEDKRKLINTNLFNEVDINIILLDDNNLSIKINLIESFYLLPSIIFELSDRNFNDWWVNFDHDFSRINYGGGFLQYNLTGRADILEFTFRRGFIRELYSSYYIPYLSKKQKGGLEANFNLIEFDHLFYNTNNYVPVFYKSDNFLKKHLKSSIEYSHRESFYNYHYFNVEYNNIKLNDTLSFLNENYFRNDKNINGISLGYEFNRDFRDIKNYPLDGFRLNFKIRKEGIGIFKNLDKWSTKIYYSNYIPLNKKFNYSFNLSTLYSSKNLPFLFYESSDKIRGYEKYLIHGYSYFIQKNSLKKKILTTSFSRENEKLMKRVKNIPLDIYLKIFFDSGVIWKYSKQTNDSYLNNKYLYSYGIGIDIVTLKNISFSSELSRNSLNENNLSFKLGADF